MTRKHASSSASDAPSRPQSGGRKSSSALGGEPPVVVPPGRGKKKKKSTEATLELKARKPGFLTQRLLHGFAAKPSRRSLPSNVLISDDSSVTMPSDYEPYADQPPKIVVEDYIGTKVTPLTSMVEEQQQDLRSIVNELRQMEEYNSNVDVVHAGNKLLDRDDMHFLQVCTSQCPHVPSFESIFENFGRVMPRPHDVALPRDFDTEDALLAVTLADEAAAENAPDPLITSPLTTHRSLAEDDKVNDQLPASPAPLDGNTHNDKPQSTMNWKTSQQTDDISSCTDTIRSSPDSLEPVLNEDGVSGSNTHVPAPDQQSSSISPESTGHAVADSVRTEAAEALTDVRAEEPTQLAAEGTLVGEYSSTSESLAGCLSVDVVGAAGLSAEVKAAGQLLPVNEAATAMEAAPDAVSDVLDSVAAAVANSTVPAISESVKVEAVVPADLEEASASIVDAAASASTVTVGAEPSEAIIAKSGAATTMESPRAAGIALEIGTEEKADEIVKVESATNTEVSGIAESATHTEPADFESKLGASTDTDGPPSHAAAGVEASEDSRAIAMDSQAGDVSSQIATQSETYGLSRRTSEQPVASTEDAVLPDENVDPSAFRALPEKSEDPNRSLHEELDKPAAIVVAKEADKKKLDKDVAATGAETMGIVDDVPKIVSPEKKGVTDESGDAKETSNSVKAPVQEEEDQVQLPVLPDEADSSVDEKESRVAFVSGTKEPSAPLIKAVTIPIPTMPLEVSTPSRKASGGVMGTETSVLASVGRDFVLCSPRWAATLAPSGHLRKAECGWVRGEATFDLRALWLASHAVAHEWSITPETTHSEGEETGSEAPWDIVPFRDRDLRLLAVRHAVVLGGAKTEEDLPSPTARSPRYSCLRRRHSAPAHGLAVRSCAPSLCGIQKFDIDHLRATWDTINRDGGRKRSPEELRTWEQHFEQHRRMKSWTRSSRRRNFSGFSPTPSSPPPEEVVLRQGEQAKALNRDDYHEEIERRFQDQLSAVRERMRQQTKRRGSQSSDLTKLLPLRSVMRDASPKSNSPIVAATPETPTPPRTETPAAAVATPKISAAKVVTESNVKPPPPKRKPLLPRATKPRPTPDTQSPEKEVVTDFRSLLKKTGRLEALAKAKGGSPKAAVGKASVEHSAIRPSDARNLFEKRAKEQEKTSGQTPSAEWFLQQVGKYQQT